MNTIFKIVSSLLVWLAEASGLSYNEVNVVVYYFIIPAISANSRTTCLLDQ